KAKSTEDCEPVMVLNEACLNHHEYSLELLRKVKEFSILANVKVVLGSEGFSDIELNYMGGLWIIIGFKSKDTKAKFQSCVGAVSWFSQIIQASKEFDIDERITWVDIEGIPLKLWSEHTFNRIAAKWGKILYMECKIHEKYRSFRRITSKASRKLSGPKKGPRLCWTL
nr:nucleotide-binding alpha-beta plait domain-containing protein [Tanacetum cinerariifolium]